VAVLNDEQIIELLPSVNGWSRNGKTLRRVVTAKDFIHAMGFVQSVALLAEKADHHPDIDIRWNKVTLELSTHSEGGLTEKDFLLASQINSLVSSQV
jgi:4a-hydroxytetrahydrobiopterin dehydratase